MLVRCGVRATSGWVKSPRIREVTRFVFLLEVSKEVGLVSLLSAAVCAVWLVDNDVSNQSASMVGTCIRRGRKFERRHIVSRRAAVVLFTSLNVGTG
jgi:hypothetical protein